MPQRATIVNSIGTPKVCSVESMGLWGSKMKVEYYLWCRALLTPFGAAASQVFLFRFAQRVVQRQEYQVTQGFLRARTLSWNVVARRTWQFWTVTLFLQSQVVYVLVGRHLLMLVAPWYVPSKGTCPVSRVDIRNLRLIVKFEVGTKVEPLMTDYCWEPAGDPHLSRNID